MQKIIALLLGVALFLGACTNAPGPDIYLVPVTVEVTRLLPVTVPPLVITATPTPVSIVEIET